MKEKSTICRYLFIILEFKESRFTNRLIYPFLYRYFHRKISEIPKLINTEWSFKLTFVCENTVRIDSISIGLSFLSATSALPLLVQLDGLSVYCWYACCGFIVGMMLVYCRYTFSILLVYCRYTVGILSVYCRYTFGILSVYCRYTVGILSLYCRYTVSILSVSCR